MSASKKLARTMTTPEGEQRALNALPQIVAVIEAAEASGDYIIGSKISMEHPFVTERIRDIRAALTALEEALG